MRFRCERDTLVEALGAVTRAATGSRAGGSALAGAIRLALEGNQLVLTGTDRELLTIQVTLSVDGSDDGVALLPARLVLDIVRNLEPGAVLVEVGEDDAHISAGRSQFGVHIVAGDFPRTPEPAGPGFTVAAELLNGGLDRVVPAASRDENRRTLNGVLVAGEGDGLRLVATDTYRLALSDLRGIPSAAGLHVLLPARALRELSRLLVTAETVTCYLGERTAVFDFDTVRLATQVVDGEFPNYRQLLPQSHRHRLTVSRLALLEAIKRVRLLAMENAPNIRLQLSSDLVELKALHQEKGEAVEELDASYEGDELTVAFNPEFLADGVSAIVGDEVVLDLTDPMRPAVLRGTESEDFLYLLMPVRVP